MKPTYSAHEIKRLIISIPVEYDTLKIIVDIIEEEIDLYSEDELMILCEASMIMFTRCMLRAGLGRINKPR